MFINKTTTDIYADECKHVLILVDGLEAGAGGRIRRGGVRKKTNVHDQNGN